MHFTPHTRTRTLTRTLALTTLSAALALGGCANMNETQQGTAKGLALQVRWGMHRNNAAQGELNVNQVRLLAEMPVRIF